ncbi:hypothetical protein HMSSN036_73670 [Paenibacillus macerans]|nr:hypothetical protein HMSSN036_73670 [Paenibacillus macerans]
MSFTRNHIIRNRAVWWGIAILALMLALSGCGSNQSQGASGNTTKASNGTPAAENGNSSGNTAAGAVRTVKHAMGETKIEGTPKRIVVLTNEGTEALLALGVKPIGASAPGRGTHGMRILKTRWTGLK